MGFFKKLSDELSDRNLPEGAFASLDEEIAVDDQEKERLRRLEELEKLYPQHPEYIALKPAMTEQKLLKQPACRYYSMIFGFAGGMMLFGLLNLFGLGLPQSAYIWFEILGLFAGIMLSMNVLEVRWRIPFENGTPEQQKEAVARYLAQQQGLSQ